MAKQIEPTVLILAAGDISSRLPFIRSGCACPALLPVHTKHLVSRVLEAYEEQPVAVHLFVDQQHLNDVENGVDLGQCQCTLHGIPATKSVVDTLRLACSVTEGDEVIVNVVTTVPTELPRPGEVQIAEMPRRGNWAAVSLDDSKRGFHPRGESPPSGAKAFIGIFRAERQALKDSLSRCREATDLLQVVEALDQARHCRFRVVEWIDFGHEANYHRSLAKLINSRSFNTIAVDTEQGSIRKSSSDHVKLAREVDYLESLPERLKLFYPRLLSRKNSMNGTESYEMEYYAYPCLSEYLLFWDLSEETWWRCYDGIDSMLNAFRAFPSSVGPQAYSEFMVRKVFERVEMFLGSGIGQRFRKQLESGVRVNGRLLPGVRQFLTAFEKRVMREYDESCFGVCHGDLCFNNILFDSGSGVVRLIDPRGSFGERLPGIYGDWRYDLAKLSHSANGGYDYIVNGFYRLDGGGADWSFRTATRQADSWLKEMTEWLLGRHAADGEFVRLLEASLFLSMCPLHADDSRRQLAFFLRGLEIGSEII